MFKELGLIYRPSSAIGWIITAAALAFCVQVFVFVDSRSHSVTDTLYGIFPYVATTLLGLYVLAMRTTQGRSGLRT